MAVSQNDVVGFARIHHRRDSVTTLYDIAVQSPLRQHGIGRALLAAVVDAAVQHGQREVRLKCPVGLSANGFYARLGFTECEPQPGKRVPVNVWSLPLVQAQSAFRIPESGASIKTLVRSTEPSTPA